MISIKHKFIVITPPKTGSTSLVSTLIDKIYYNEIIPQREVPLCFDYKDGFGGKHATIQNIHNKWDTKRYGKWEDYKKYLCIRNPWDRIVSWWKWSGSGNFEDFWLFKNEKNHLQMRTLNSLFEELLEYAKLNGKIDINNFIIFEDLQNTFNAFCDDVDIQKHELPHHNSTNHNHYSKYYNEKTKDYISKLYKNDIKFFKYNYEEKI